MTGVPCSEAPGVPGGVLVTIDWPLERRRKRSAEPFCCCSARSSTIACFRSESESVVRSVLGGSVSLGASVVSEDSLGPAVDGRLSGLDAPLPPPDSFEELFLDLKTPLSRPTGEGDLLLDCDDGGASPTGFGDPKGSESPR